jgi:mismatch-specific thymine-DNA glycosylase
MRNILPDHLRGDSRMLIVGCNPSPTAAETGVYYSGPKNQFWSLLRDSGLVSPETAKLRNAALLPMYGIGITDLVKKRATACSGDVRAHEFKAGAAVLCKKLGALGGVQVVVFNGKVVYEKFTGKRCEYGVQGEKLNGAIVIVAPSSSARAGRQSYEEKLCHWRCAASLMKNGHSASSREQLSSLERCINRDSGSECVDGSQ